MRKFLARPARPFFVAGFFARLARPSDSRRTWNRAGSPLLARKGAMGGRGVASGTGRQAGAGAADTARAGAPSPWALSPWACVWTYLIFK